MKKLIVLFCCLFFSVTAFTQIQLSQPVAFDELSEAVFDKVRDDNKQLCALIVVEVTGLTLEQLSSIRLDTDAGSNVILKDQPENNSELKFYISPSATYFEVAIRGYSKVRLALKQELTGGKLYHMKMHARPLEVEINILSNVKKDASVFIDNDFVGITPLAVRVKYGVPFTIRVEGDIPEVKEGVVITEESEKNFTFDHILGSKNITLHVSHAAEVRVDEKVMGNTKNGVPFILNDLVYGKHTISVRALDFNDIKERNIMVSATSPDQFEFLLENTKKVTIDANIKGAVVSIDGKQMGETQLITDLTYGRHEMIMSNAGKSKKGMINVTEKNSYFKWKLPKPGTRYHRGYSTRDIELRPIGLSIGYVQKQWIYKADGQTLKAGFWGEKPKFLHGLQAGIRVEPHLGWWFYINTGLYYEFYYSKSEEVETEDGYNILGKFMEHSLYMPVHLDFKMPVSDNFYFYIDGGIGIDCGVHASVDMYEVGEEEPFETDDSIYGNADWGDLKRFNLSGEFGGGFCIKRMKFGCTVSKGLLDTSLGEGYSVKQNKLSAFFTFMF